MKIKICLILVGYIFLLFFKCPFEVFLNMANAFASPMAETFLLWWEVAPTIKSENTPSDWRDIRRKRLEDQINRGRTKLLFLCYGQHFSENRLQQHYQNGLEEKIKKSLDKAVIWVKDPNGRISPIPFNHVKNKLSINIPKDVELNGLYLVGARLDIGQIDVDHDGKSEKVYLSAKCIIPHYKTGGSQGNKRSIFFNDPVRFPLEIGCSNFWFRRGYQKAYNEYEMKVLYRGKPLANAEVVILSRSGWKKITYTDANGKFLITPFGEMENDGQGVYLYVTCHQDVFKEEYHCATLTMNVYTSPEWCSKSNGFTLWTIAGATLVVIIVVSGIYWKEKHNKEIMEKFDNFKVKKV